MIFLNFKFRKNICFESYSVYMSYVYLIECYYDYFLLKNGR